MVSPAIFEGTANSGPPCAPAEPLVSVIIPVYRDWERLDRCLEALGRQSVPPSRLEILVVDNEPDGGRSVTRLPANARLLHEPRPGSYAARNKAVAEARGLYLAFTDSDCVPDRDWIERSVAALEAAPGARVAGRVSTFREPDTGYLAYVYDLHTAFPQRQYAEAGLGVTANLIVEKAVFDRIGPFDECYSGGDIQWNRRAQAAGVPIVYRDDVRVGHPARHDLAAIIRKRRRTVAASLDMPARRFLVDRIKPPVRRFMGLRRKGVSRREALLVASIHWMVRLVQVQEFSFIRLGLKRPSRS